MKKPGLVILVAALVGLAALFVRFCTQSGVGHSMARAKMQSGDPGQARTPDGTSAPAGIPVAVNPGDRSTAQDLFQKVLAKRRAPGPLPPSLWQMSRFSLEIRLHLREARLLALSLPREIREISGRLAQDRDADAISRELAVYMLGILSRSKDHDAQALLFLIASENKDALSGTALRYLAQSDAGGEYRAFFWKKAEEGMTEAVGALGNWVDPRSIEILNSITQHGQVPIGSKTEVVLVAEKSLRKQKLLQSSEAMDRVLEYLEKPYIEHQDLTDWALEIVGFQPTPRALTILRRRLDLGKAAALASHERLTLAKKSEGHYEPLEENPEASLVRQPDLRKLTGDGFYDHALILYSDLGGQLNDWEKRRLYEFGYACDPKARLSELLTESR